MVYSRIIETVLQGKYAPQILKQVLMKKVHFNLGYCKLPSKCPGRLFNSRGQSRGI